MTKSLASKTQKTFKVQQFYPFTSNSIDYQNQRKKHFLLEKKLLEVQGTIYKLIFCIILMAMTHKFTKSKKNNK